MLKKAVNRIERQQSGTVPSSRPVTEKELFSTMGIHVEKRIIRRKTDAL